METKICAKCGEEKPLTKEYWHRHRDFKDGFNSQCKVCKALSRKNYYENNKEKAMLYYEENKIAILERRKNNYELNKESILEYQVKYREENQKDIVDKKKQYYKKHKEEIALRDEIYYKENKQKIIEKNREYRQNNRCVYQGAYKNRKARIKTLPFTLSAEQWDRITLHFDNSCAYCGMTEEESKGKWNERLHQEHFIALYNGGGYTHNNIIPACKTCNCSKTNKDFFEWYPTYEHYNRDREKKILDFLGYTTENTQQLALL